MSEPKWFYARGEERFGPVTSQKLKALAANGKLLPEDLIWKEDMPDWSPASQLRGLFPSDNPPGTDEDSVLPAPEETSPAVEEHPSPPQIMEPLVTPQPSGRTKSWRGNFNVRSVSGNPLHQVGQYGQFLLLSGLLLVVLAKGCDGIGNRYVGRLNAQYQLTVNQFEDEYLAKQNDVRAEISRLEQVIGDDAPTPEQRESMETLRKRITEIVKERDRKAAENQRTKWSRLKIKSRDAASRNNMWGFWRECLFSLGTLVLTIGLLTVGFNGQGADRWICLIMLAIITFSIYVGGIAWINSLATLIPR